MIEAYFHELWWLLGALFFGVMLGSLTGLIPGFPRQQRRSHPTRTFSRIA